MLYYSYVKTKDWKIHMTSVKVYRHIYKTVQTTFYNKQFELCTNGNKTLPNDSSHNMIFVYIFN